MLDSSMSNGGLNAGAYAPLILSTMGKKSGRERSLAYVLGNMLSAGGMHEATPIH